MDTKLETKPDQDFCLIIDVAKCKDLIKSNVADLIVERAALAAAIANPQPVDAATRKLLDLGPNTTFTTVDMARQRVEALEDAQGRLWDWYKRLTTDGG